MSLGNLDLRGLNPAPVTPFTLDGDVDYTALTNLGKFLASVEGVKSLVVLGHAGEGTFLTQDEQVKVIETLGAKAALTYPSHGWLRFGYQDGAPQDRYRAIWEEAGLPQILFQYPDNTKATYNLDTQLEIAGQEGVFWTKNGVRNMRRWDTEIPVLRREYPDLQIFSCHDEYLLHTIMDVDGLLVGYGNMAPELLVEFIKAGKAQDWTAAKAIHNQLLPLTKAVYHRGSHMEGTVALKHALVARGILPHATVRSPLLPLADGADVEIADALRAAGII